MNINDMTEQEQILKVMEYDDCFSDIKNPSEAVQLAAVNKEGCLIRHIKNPSEAVKEAAVNQNGRAFEYIKNPSEKVKFAAVNQNRTYIYIENPTEEMQNMMIDRVYNIKFCQTIELEYEQYIIRVPGGWIYRETFIPYISKKELKETLFNQG